MAILRNFLAWSISLTLWVSLFGATPLHAKKYSEFKIGLCRHYLHLAANAGSDKSDDSTSAAVQSVRRLRRETFGDEAPAASYAEVFENSDLGGASKVAARLRGIEDFYLGTGSARELGEQRKIYAQQFVGKKQISEFLEAYEELSQYEKLLKNSRTKSKLLRKSVAIDLSLIGAGVFLTPGLISAGSALLLARVKIYLSYITQKNHAFLEDMIQKLENPTPHYWSHLGINTALVSQDIDLLKNTPYGTKIIQEGFESPQHLVNVSPFHTLDFELGKIKIPKPVYRHWAAIDMIFETDKNGDPVLTLVARTSDKRPIDPPFDTPRGYRRRQGSRRSTLIPARVP